MHASPNCSSKRRDSDGDPRHCVGAFIPERVIRLSVELSVVIPTYNQAHLLAECLHSLSTQTLAPDAYEIIVVDDGSTDRTAAVLTEFDTRPVRLRGIRFPMNRGRSAARNAGITCASAPLILFVDSDVVVREDFLAWHLRTHRERGPGTLSRGPVVLVPDSSAARNGQVPPLATSPAYLDTANAAVERSALLRAGLFDEGFPGYGWEDFELGIRLAQLGIRRTYCRQAVAYHVYPPVRWDDLGHLLRKETERAKSALYFYRKHPTFETRMLIQATLIHRLLYWVQAGCGILTPENVLGTARQLRRARLDNLAHLALRGVLNRHYILTLGVEFKRHAATLA